MMAPGGSCWPSEIGVVVLNTPTGGAALVIVRLTLPVLAMSKLCVALCPTATEPKATGAGVMLRCGLPVTAVPASATVTEPALPFTTSEPLWLPAAVGAYATLTVTEAPAASVEPLEGRPVAVNGAVGTVDPVMVSDDVPVLVMLTLSVTLAPVGTVPKDSADGVAPSPG